ncbi:MAG: 5-formyltetrahydrofolate cyclo-ligase [Trueperaceae bacterium]|nr:5-formyltetrahydrofolate cyclo-ligase [Trueperaceae bacterium]
MIPPAPDAPKAAWRRWARGVRGALDAAAWGAGVRATLAAWPPYREAAWVALYAAMGSEADLAPWPEDGPRVALPRVEPDGRMTFRAAEGPLERHPLGMRQPTRDAADVPPAALDVVVAPGLAFDAAGGRLGYGGGTYDAWFAEHAPRAVRAGVAHPDLIVPTLPTEPHDIRMDVLVLASGVRPVGAADPRRP